MAGVPRRRGPAEVHCFRRLSKIVGRLSRSAGERPSRISVRRLQQLAMPSRISRARPRLEGPGGSSSDPERRSGSIRSSPETSSTKSSGVSRETRGAEKPSVRAPLRAHGADRIRRDRERATGVPRRARPLSRRVRDESSRRVGVPPARGGALPRSHAALVRGRVRICRGRSPPGRLGSPDPVEIPLGRGKRFLPAGTDRPDRPGGRGPLRGSGITDGGTYGIEEGRGLRGGRQIQPALYAAAVEALLERCGEKGSVSRSGYFFPEREGAAGASPNRSTRRRSPHVLTRVRSACATARFRTPPDPDACDYCASGLCAETSGEGGGERQEDRKTQRIRCSPLTEASMTTSAGAGFPDQRTATRSSGARRNFLVEAAAGTGKTTSLVSRVVELLAEGERSSSASRRSPSRSRLLPSSEEFQLALEKARRDERDRRSAKPTRGCSRRPGKVLHWNDSRLLRATHSRAASRGRASTRDRRSWTSSKPCRARRSLEAVV